MNTLLVFFALPIATIILAIVLQKILKNPLLVAATFFAIFLVVTFAFFDVNFLIFAIVYTFLAYIAAILTQFICRLFRNLENNNGNCRIIERPITISNTCPNNNVNLNNTALLQTTANTCRNNCNCGCNCNRR